MAGAMDEEEFILSMSQQNGHSQHGKRKKTKTFNDPIHGHFKLGPLSIAFIDNLPFQRLRHLKQLGLTYYVFPGACHNRFEHSLGVAQCAAKWARKLQQNDNSIGIEERDIALVEVAGLCHDLGHGPFSHVFEHEVLPRITGTASSHDNCVWSHETMSQQILDFIIDRGYVDLSLYDLIPEDIELVKNYMTGARKGEKKFLFDIVANKRNSIDVDKFDYLARDAQCTGVKVSCDFGRLMQYSQVIDDEICFKWSEYEMLHQLFHDRARMHSKVYTHRKAKAVEYMVIDALEAAEPVLQMQQKIQEVESFLKMDDTILRTIDLLDPEASEHSAAIRKAQAMLERLHRRELYAFCAEVCIPEELVYKLKLPTADEIIYHQEHNSGVDLRAADVIVSETKINFAMRDKNPLESTHFYYTDGNKERIPQQRVSAMMPRTFQDVKFRVYSKDRNSKVVTALNTAFRNWVRRHLPRESAAGDGENGRRDISPDLDEHMTPLPNKKRSRLELGGSSSG